jgi:hypothetical protein
MLGPEHPHTLASIVQLRSVLWRQGQLADAEALKTKIMDTDNKRIPGDGHLDVLTGTINLGFVFWLQGRPLSRA